MTISYFATRPWWIPAFIGKGTTKSWDVLIFATSQLPVPRESVFLVGESEITAYLVERMFYCSKGRVMEIIQ